MELFLLIAPFALALLGTLRSPGWGLAAVVAVGYLNGVVRANYLGAYSTFMFDAAVFGLYAGFVAFHPRQAAAALRHPAGAFVLLLAAWPVVMTAVPVNDYLVQLVALRGTVWFLPVLLIATRLTDADLTAFTRALAGLNLFALAVAVYEFVNGIEAVFPKNAVTDIMYRSNDVAGYTAFRIPSTFLNAHQYGGTMLNTMPLLLARLFGRGVGVYDRVLAAAGTGAAVAGLLLCAARYPVVVLAVTVLVAWVVSRFSVWFGLAAVALMVAGLGLASTSERLQRGVTLDDTEMVSRRVGGSVNESFLDVLVDYPLGAGMGSSVGTSIPFFLSDRAPEQVGLENEFSRITVDQGWVGLGLWVAFLVWLLARPPHARFAVPWQLGRVLTYALAVSCWGTAFIGNGLLSSVPGSVMLLALMGVLAADRGTPAADPAATKPSLPPAR
jgi:hypothetical protein